MNRLRLAAVDPAWVRVLKLTAAGLVGLDLVLALRVGLALAGVQ